MIIGVICFTATLVSAGVMFFGTHGDFNVNQTVNNAPGVTVTGPEEAPSSILVGASTQYDFSVSSATDLENSYVQVVIYDVSGIQSQQISNGGTYDQVNVHFGGQDHAVTLTAIDQYSVMGTYFIGTLTTGSHTSNYVSLTYNLAGNYNVDVTVGQVVE